MIWGYDRGFVPYQFLRHSPETLVYLSPSLSVCGELDLSGALEQLKRDVVGAKSQLYSDNVWPLSLCTWLSTSGFYHNPMSHAQPNLACPLAMGALRGAADTRQIPRYLQMPLRVMWMEQKRKNKRGPAWLIQNMLEHITQPILRYK